MSALLALSGLLTGLGYLRVNQQCVAVCCVIPIPTHDCSTSCPPLCFFWFGVGEIRHTYCKMSIMGGYNTAICDEGVFSVGILLKIGNGFTNRGVPDEKFEGVLLMGQT